MTDTTIPVGDTGIELRGFDTGAGVDEYVRVAGDLQVGTWGYKSGTSGTPSIPVGARIIQITAASAAGGSFTINGGDTITIPANQALTVEPKGNLVAPTVVFTDTDSYFVEYVS